MHPLLQKIIDTNHQISELVGSMLWDEALALSRVRDDSLREYFDITPLPDENSIVSQVIVDITQSDQAITALIANKKSELISDGLSLKNSHDAIQQYRHTQIG